MYRHEAIALLRKHQQQCKSDIEIKPWMVDAVLEADKLAHEIMGVDTSESEQDGKPEKDDLAECKHTLRGKITGLCLACGQTPLPLSMPCAPCED